MNPTVSLIFRYHQRDYSRAMRAHYATRHRLWLDIPLITVVAGLGLYLWRFPDLHGSGIFFVCIGIGTVFALQLIWAFLVMPILVFRSQPEILGEYQLTFSPQGIHFHTEHIDSELKWSLYTRALVDANTYVLYYGARTFTVIPKRVFQSVDQRGSFEELLKQNVKRVVWKDR